MSAKLKLVELFNLMHSRYGDNIYNIGILPFDENILSLNKMPVIKWLKHSFKDRWFADPFIVKEDEKTYTIFVEVYFFKKRKGSIGLIVADKVNFELKKFKVILDLATHLSFPVYYISDGCVYVYPENSQSGNNKLYRFNEDDECLEECQVWCDFPLTDGVILNKGDNKFILSTYLNDSNYNYCHILKLEKSKFVEFDNVLVTDNTARSAGDFFTTKSGDLIRPSQDCNGGYGRGLVFQKVDYINDKFILTEINRLFPNDSKYKDGLHTYNKFGYIAVVDGYYKPFKLYAIIFDILLKLYVRIFK